LNRFAEWLSTTFLSVFIQNHNAWAIPAIQSIHIVGIGVVMGSVLMIDLRILGLAGRDQTLRQTAERFVPWLTGALYLMLATGILMVIAEPVRELITISFWVKMFLVAAGTVVVVLFRRKVKSHGLAWEQDVLSRPAVQVAAIAMFLVWTAIIVLGRLIAYDHVWGSWSPAKKA
jgi:hypothetical protein